MSSRLASVQITAAAMKLTSCEWLLKRLVSGGEEVWAASLDLEKAFDKVLHSSVFDSLSEAGVEADVVRAMWRLYANQ